MRNLLRNWSFSRALRLVLAGAFLGAAATSGEWIAYVVAAVFGSWTAVGVSKRSRPFGGSPTTVSLNWP